MSKINNQESRFAKAEWVEGYNSAVDSMTNVLSVLKKSYSLIEMSSSYCTKCGSKVNLLTPSVPNDLLPQFVICPDCGFIGGETGEVKCKNENK